MTRLECCQPCPCGGIWCRDSYPVGCPSCERVPCPDECPEDCLADHKGEQ